MKRFLKWLLLFIGVAVFLILVFYAVENYRGAKAWAATKSYLESEGEALTFRELVPPLPPDEDNFCATPLIAAMTDFEVSDKREVTYRNPKAHDRIAAMRVPVEYPEKQPEIGGGGNGVLPDFEGLAKMFAESSAFTFPDRSLPPAEQILMALEVFDAEFAALAGATGRAEAIFRLEWKDSAFQVDQVWQRIVQPTPHHDDVRKLAILLLIRTVASLAADRPAMARDTVHILMRLAEAQSQEPTQMSLTWGTLLWRGVLDAIWYGLRTNAWRDEDLDWLGEKLDAGELYERALVTFRADMVNSHIDAPEWLQGTASGFETGVGHSGKWFDFIDEKMPMAAMPDGWWDLNKSEGSRITYEGAIRPLKNREDFLHLSGGFFDYEQKRPLTSLLRSSLSLSESQLRSVVRMAAGIECTRTACALEREFREKGDYPEALSSLVPGRMDEVPSDPIDRQPIRYLRTADGRYRLYSIGPDGIDNGGEVRFDPETGFPYPEKGDWVWAYSYPEREESE